ncbi:hypothetical protein [Falsibacillus albus]|nr:hypothetical protein [Falsibacillus albus]
MMGILIFLLLCSAIVLGAYGALSERKSLNDDDPKDPFDHIFKQPD